MDASITRSTTHEEQEVAYQRKRLAALEGELAQRELELATQQGELKAIELLYLRKVGSLLMQLDVLDAKINELLARFNPEDTAAAEKAQQARRHAEETRQEVGQAQAMPEERTHFTPSDQIKNLYREAAKAMHPDLATNDAEQALRTQWMVAVNAAYQAGDDEKLRSLLEEWLNSPEAVQGEDICAELERLTRKVVQVEKRIHAIKVEIRRLKSTFAWDLRQRIQSAQALGKDLLEEMAAKTQRQINKKQSLLEELMKKAPPPKNGQGGPPVPAGNEKG
ncbi:MAG: hypothetical protein JW726_04075 [Anaerolineales bacterium]|nr:hypothetical protein [Anaerolineales bacterium]